VIIQYNFISFEVRMTVQPIGVLMFCNNVSKTKPYNYTETHGPEYGTFCHVVCATLPHIT